MIRSGRAALLMCMVAVLVGPVALGMVLLEHWLAAEILGGTWVLLMAVASLLLRHADKAEMQRRSSAAERWIVAYGQVMAKQSGGWLPRSSKPPE